MQRPIAMRRIRRLAPVVALALLAGCSDRSLPTGSDAGADGGGLRPGANPLAWVNVGPTVFARVTPSPQTYTEPADYLVFDGSGSGDVTASVAAVDIAIVGGPDLNTLPVATSTSGCEAADFAGFPVGSIALIQRGGCNFDVKVNNAIAAGARAVVVFNEGQAGRTEALPSQLPTTVSVPVLSASYAVGWDLWQRTLSGGVTVRVATNTAESSATAAIDAEGTVNPTTGAVTVSGTLGCAGAPTIQLRLTVTQEQKAKRVPATIVATQDVTLACDAAGSWTATLAPLSGAFVNGTADVTAEPLTSVTSAAQRTVKLGWAKKVK